MKTKVLFWMKYDGVTLSKEIDFSFAGAGDYESVSDYYDEQLGKWVVNLKKEHELENENIEYGWRLIR